MTNPKPDEMWLDRRPMTDRREWRDEAKFRRVITVTSFDPNGFVEGSSDWHEKKRGRWEPMGCPRTTRIRADVFMRRFERLEES